MREKADGLLQRVHQTCNCAVQVFIRPAQLFDLIDGVQHCGVVLATELAADLGERRGGELLDDVHGYLAWKSNRACVATDLEVLLPQIKMLAHTLLDQVDGDAFFLRGDDVAQHLT